MGVAAKAKATRSTRTPSLPVVAKAKASTKKAASTKTSHPATSEMVNVAIDTLKERKGSSLQAIKKYIAGKYVVDIKRLSPFIKKYLRLAVAKNIIVQTTGTGASGRFKLAKLTVESKPKKVSTESAAPAKNKLNGQLKSLLRMKSK